MEEYCDQCGQKITSNGIVVDYHDCWFRSYDCLHDFIDEQSDEFDLGDITAYSL